MACRDRGLPHWRGLQGHGGAEAANDSNSGVETLSVHTFLSQNPPCGDTLDSCQLLRRVMTLIFLTKNCFVLCQLGHFSGSEEVLVAATSFRDPH